MRRHIMWVRAAWGSIREPKAITLQIGAIYAIIGTAGLAAIITPPMSVDGTLGPLYTVVWAWMMCVGGYGAALFTPSGAWLWERPFLILVIGAGVLYLYTIIVQVATTTSGNRITQALVVLAVLGWLGVRLQRIFREPYEPGR